jgi:glycosyltransferase involved in cell wall biosynthesis
LKSDGIEISIVSPVYRTSAFLTELLLRIENALQPLGLTYEIVFVNDACPEGSGAVLQQITKTNLRVGVVDLRRNWGQNRATLMGLRWVRGRYVAILDSDLQDPPELIPDLYARALMPDRPDAVLVTRTGMYEPVGRLITSYILKGLLSLILDLPFGAGSYCLLSRPAVLRLLDMRVREPYLLAMIGAAGLRVRSIRATRAARPTGSSSYTAFKRLRLGLAALETAFTARFALGHWLSIKEQLASMPYDLYGAVENVPFEV